MANNLIEEEKVYIIEEKGLPNALRNLDFLLSSIEVKGDSVKHVYDARNIISQLFDLMKEKEEDKKITKIKKS